MPAERTHARWEQVKQLFHQAGELPRGERARFLDSTCGEDGELRAEVESLLAARSEAGDFLNEAAWSEGAVPDLTGQQIGPWRVERELGRGGMGVVYLAARVDGQFEQRVALKVLHRGMDSDAVLRRFLAERRILASLVHPNIARLLDGGTTPDGRPYFVMEAIEGQSLLRYCEGNALDLAARLRLFIAVCDAVHHAHQKLVLHRDLKPDNILVDAQGVPKLLDFGIAKLLSGTEDSELTLLGGRPMTPEYASPEQLRSEPLTTASDVYSLGVILYRLLTGGGPFGSGRADSTDRLQAALTEEPVRPSVQAARGGERIQRTWRRRIEGDLDNILLKALARAAEQRYSSAEQLASDLRRHLAGLPVAAHPPSLAYRAGKYVRRHRLVVASTVAAVLALSAGLVTTLWQARIALREKEKAERRFQEVRRLARAFIFDVDGGIQHLAGATPVREQVVSTAIEYLDRLSREAEGDTTLQLELAQGYRKIGDIQGHPNMPNLGDTRGARESYRKALAIARSVLALQPARAESRLALWSALVRLGDVTVATEGVAAALPLYTEALEVCRGSLASHPEDRDLPRDLQQTYRTLAEAEARRGNDERALEYARAMRESAAAFRKAYPDHPEAARDMLVAEQRVGTALMNLERPDQALPGYLRAYEETKALAAAQPENAQLRFDEGVFAEKMALALTALGRANEALPWARRDVAISEKQAAASPGDAFYTRSLLDARHQLGLVLSADGRQRAARVEFEKARVLTGELRAADPADAELKRVEASLALAAGEADVSLGSIRQGLDELGRAQALQRQIVAKNPTDIELRSELAKIERALGQALSRALRLAEAEAHQREALAIAATLSKAHPGAPRLLAGAAETASALGELRARQGDRKEACALQAQAAASWQELSSKRPLVGERASQRDQTLRRLAACRPPSASGLASAR